MTSNSLLSTKLLYSLNSKRYRNKTLLQKGFTLVELMVVIVIVGILSAVALPGFLSQATKAKGTEAKSEISSIIKNAAAEYQFDGSSITTLTASNVCTNLGGKANSTSQLPQKFNYTCTWTPATDTLAVRATGAPATAGGDPALEGKYIQQLAVLDTGAVTLDKANTCLVFGGTITASPCQ